MTDEDLERKPDPPAPPDFQPEPAHRYGWATNEESPGIGAFASSGMTCESCGAALAPGQPSLPCEHCGRARPMAPTAPETGSAAPGAPIPPHWTPGATAAGAVTTSLLCICGYDLNATPLGGNCPECGARVVDALGERDQRVQGRAVAALVLSCTALPMYCACGPAAIPVSIIAVMLGIAVLRSGDRMLSADRTMAIIALVVGGIGLLIGVGYSVLLLVMLTV